MAQLFQHILVPLDFTDKNQEALWFALKLAKQNGSRVTLLHVIEKVGYFTDDEIEKFYEMLRTRAHEKLVASAEPFQEGGLRVATKIVMGNTARRIIEVSLRNDVDLVLLSSHKIELDEAPKGFATLSYQVSILCQCPVMLVK